MNSYFTPAYVIKYWYANNQPDGDGNYVVIQARREGFFSWILSLFKIEPSVELRCTRSHLHFTESTFQGNANHVTPMRGVCSMLSGYEKPFVKALMITILLAFLGSGAGAAITNGPGGLFGGLFVGGLVGLVIGCISYFLNKVFTLGFTMNSGEVTWIRFKRSVIEGQAIDQSQAEYVVQLVESLVESRAGRAQTP